MKKVYIYFDTPYFSGDYSENNYTYSDAFKVLAIDNVIEVSYNDGYIDVTYKTGMRGTPRIKTRIKTNTIKNICIN